MIGDGFDRKEPINKNNRIYYAVHSFLQIWMSEGYYH